MAGPVILGIDLGTTNSLCGYMTPSGPVVVRDASGNALVPSVIAFSQGKVRILRPIVQLPMSPMLATRHELALRRAKGSEPVGYDPLWRLACWRRSRLSPLMEMTVSR